MRKFLSGLMAAAMLATVMPAAVSADGLSVPKTNYIVGTGGVISGGSEYVSSAPDVVSVSADGSFTANAAGTATITGTGGSVDITVYDSAKEDLVNDIKAENASGAMNISSPRWGDMHTMLAGSKLWAYGMNSTIGYSADTSSLGISYEALMNNGGWVGGGQWMGLVYKVENPSESIYAQLFYDANMITAQDVVDKRVYIGYRSSDYSWRTDRANALSEMRDANGDGYSSRSYDLARIISTSVEQDNVTPALNTDIWTQIPVSAEKNLKDYDAAGTGDLFIEADGIPSDAQYVVLMINNGAAGDDDPTLTTYSPWRIGVRKVTLSSEKKLAAGEVTEDNKIALTFDGDVRNPALSVKKNGKTVEANVTYDAATFTSYVDGSFAGGDYVEISTADGKSWSGTIPGGSEITDYDKIYFKVERTTYIEGTSGKIDLVAEKGDETWKNVLDTTYTSSNTEVVEVSSDGTFTAKSAGTAEITPHVTSLPDETFAAITIKVCVPDSVNSYIAEDINSGKLIFDRDLSIRGNKLSSMRNGTKLWAYMHNSNSAIVDNDGYIYHAGGADDAYMGFVYKAEDEIEGITVYEFLYGDANRAKVRTEVGYLTDDTKTFAGRSGVTYTWGDENLDLWGAEGGIVDNAEQGSLRTLDPIWEKVTVDDSAWTIDNPERNAIANIQNIPSDAKYIAVLLNEGKLADGTAAIDDQHFRYKGVTINYAKKLAGAAVNDENVAVLTFNTDPKKVSLTVKLDGETVENPKITYAGDGYTCYVDAGRQDSQVFTIETAYGNFEEGAKDSRERITKLEVLDADGNQIETLTPTEAAALTVNASLVNSDDKELNLYAALYGSDGSLIDVTCTKSDVANGAASAQLSMNIEEVPEGATLKIYTWNEKMQGYVNYNNFQTEFETADF